MKSLVRMLDLILSQENQTQYPVLPSKITAQIRPPQVKDKPAWQTLWVIGVFVRGSKQAGRFRGMGLLASNPYPKTLRVMTSAIDSRDDVTACGFTFVLAIGKTTISINRMQEKFSGFSKYFLSIPNQPFFSLSHHS